MRRRAIKWFFTGGGALAVIALGLALALALPGSSGQKEEAAAQRRDDEGAVAEAAQEVPADTEVVQGLPEGPGASEGPEKKEPPQWDRPRFEARKDERLLMVEGQIERRGVEDPDVLEAMRQVPRHLFVPRDGQRLAYADHPLPIGYGQTISQPYIVALMTDLLEVEAGDKVLEIGTGSSYQAAVLSELTPYVCSIEIIRELAEQAGQRLGDLGYKTIQTKRGDGYYGWREHAPFDGIIVTAAAGHIPPPLLVQLKPGGKMVIPVGGVYETQHLVVVSKDEEGRIRTRSVLAVRFVPMTGRVQSGE